jgi:hypothetical protein
VEKQTDDDQVDEPIDAPMESVEPIEETKETKVYSE